MHSLKNLCCLLTIFTLAGCTPDAPETTVVIRVAPPVTKVKADLPGRGTDSRKQEDSIPRRADDNNLLLGNPSNASQNSGRDQDNYLVEREAHAMSFNRRNGGPNWVAWHLDKADRGSAPRSDFMPDPLLPATWQIRPTDYRGSGYDRGHVCPSADRTRDRQLNQQTFVMSNMLPQAPALNQQVWKDFEDYSRSLIRNRELYIIAGGHGSAERLAGSKVNVPAVCWKIVLVLPQGDNDLARINQDTRVIAVSMPNRQRQEIADSKWPQWTTSVAQLEKTTGYDFFSALPDDVERALERKIDAGSAAVAPRISRSVPQSSAPAQAAERAPTQEEQPRRVGLPGQVWVNTGSGIYHRAGCRWYGNTKNGAFMSEAQAIKLGNRVARDE